MNRRRAREEAFIILFQLEFRKNLDELLEDFFEANENVGEQADYIRQICERATQEREKIGEIIEKYSTNWKKDRISLVSLAVMRLATCEMLYFDDIPNVVSLAEALELGKKFEGEESVGFINGILENVRAEAEGAKPPVGDAVLSVPPEVLEVEK